MAVPKRIQQMGGLFYGMLANLSAALDENNFEELRATISRNIYDGEQPETLAVLTDYVLAQATHLQDIDASTILSGRLELRDLA